MDELEIEKIPSDIIISDKKQEIEDQKWWTALMLGLVYAALSSPPAYSMTKQVTNYITHDKDEESLKLYNLIIRALIFIFIIRIIL